ncbi:MAG: hypothetical protein HYT12_03850 [Candidatus Liptonbacteria bacterium]|nr:hypothetical protein [Candidatus Liptonbacteria bacterium]
MTEKYPKELKQESQEYYNRLADKLNALQKVKNDGRGMNCVRAIVLELLRGDIGSAKAIAWNEQDKINDALGMNKDIKEVIIHELFCDEKEHPWSIEEKIKNWKNKK